MKNKFLQYIENSNHFKLGDKALLALSGGVDSVVLFHLLHENNIDFHCAHVNYQLRDEASEEDETFVKRLCKKHDVQLEVLRVDTKSYAKKEKLSIQLAARNIRYDWFNKLLVERSCKWIMTAHHRDDSIETFFINLIRGTGLKGLTGISEIRDDIYRPLLFASKEEILEYAKQEGIDFRQDQSNFDDKYLRNALRNNIIPSFVKENPSFGKTMLNNMNRLQMAYGFLDEKIEIIKRKYFEEDRDNVIISKDILSETGVRLLFFTILDPYGFNESQIDDLMNDPQTGKRIIGEQWQLTIERESYRITQVDTSNKVEGEFEIHSNFSTNFLPIEIIFSKIERTNWVMEKNLNKAYIDADKIEYPLILRKWKDGDKFQPFGMKGKKLISDFLTQQKVPAYDKRNTWVLLSGNKIAWVIGMRIGHDFRIGSDTKSIIKIDYHV